MSIVYLSIIIYPMKHNNHLYKRETTEDKVCIDRNKQELPGHAMIIANQFFQKHSRPFQYRIQIFFYLYFFVVLLKGGFYTSLYIQVRSSGKEKL